MAEDEEKSAKSIKPKTAKADINSGIEAFDSSKLSHLVQENFGCVQKYEEGKLILSKQKSTMAKSSSSGAWRQVEQEQFL